MLYISGPMTGLPGYNYAAFNYAASALRAQGWNVINPAEHFEGRTDRKRHEYLALDVIDLITKCRSIVFLPDFSRSEGARLEAQIALYLSHTCYLWNGTAPAPIRRDVLEKILSV